MSDETPPRRPKWADATDGDKLELDTDRTSGSWRGVSPLRHDVGPNTRTLDPEARHLDADEFDYIRSAAMKRVDIVPAEVAQPHGPTDDPLADAFDAQEAPRSPLHRAVASAAYGVPRSATTGAAERPSTGASRTVSGMATAIGTVEPWQMKDARRRRRMLLAIGLAAASAVAVLVFLLLR